MEEHRIILTARRFRISPWPTVTETYSKTCDCATVEAIAQELRDLGAVRVVVIHGEIPVGVAAL